MFYRDGKEVSPQGSVAVNVILPDGCEDPEVYSFSGEDGQLIRVEAKSSGSTCRFSLTESDYVAWVIPKQQEADAEDNGDQENTDNTENSGQTEDPGTYGNNTGDQTGQSAKEEASQTVSEKSEAVKTGHQTDLIIWIALGTAVIVMIIIIFQKKKRSEK